MLAIRHDKEEFNGFRASFMASFYIRLYLVMLRFKL